MTFLCLGALGSAEPCPLDVELPVNIFIAGFKIERNNFRLDQMSLSQI